nr:alpha-ketoglutarate-dependent dioxygenase AlkB [Aliamphritea spongicola]
MIEDFIQPAEQQALFSLLEQQLSWQQDQLKLFGRMVSIPRLQSFLGDAGIEYTYSNLLMKARPWLPELLSLKAQTETASQCSFNTVLANLYRDGQDSMGWHSDDEPELRRNPTIASVSLGQERRFLLRPKGSKKASIEIPLTGGSLLIMSGQLQHYWQHSVPKTARKIGPRINLTFRHTYSNGNG